MKINLTDIFSKDIEKKIKKEFNIDMIQYGSQHYKIQDGISIYLELKKIRDHEILLSGYIKTKLVLSCNRCNETVLFDLASDFSKVIDIQDEDNEDFICGYALDLEELLLSEIYLNFPMKVLCNNECKGICKKCGTNLNLHRCACDDDNIDPRLMGLKTLYNENFKEV